MSMPYFKQKAAFIFVPQAPFIFAPHSVTSGSARNDFHYDESTLTGNPLFKRMLYKRFPGHVLLLSEHRHARPKTQQSQMYLICLAHTLQKLPGLTKL